MKNGRKRTEKAIVRTESTIEATLTTVNPVLESPTGYFIGSQLPVIPSKVAHYESETNTSFFGAGKNSESIEPQIRVLQSQITKYKGGTVRDDPRVVAEIAELTRRKAELENRLTTTKKSEGNQGTKAVQVYNDNQIPVEVARIKGYKQKTRIYFE